MKDMSVTDMKSINDRVFEQIARSECEASVGSGRYVPCGKPATKVIKWRHQDGDREHRLLCTEHAFEKLGYWDTMDWDAGAEMSDVEDWKLGVCYGGRTATRVGTRFRDTAA